MTYQFKKFESRNARFEDRITITKSNSIGFPTKFYENNNIKNYKFVTLYYDLEKKAVGINFNNDPEEKNKFTIIHSKDGYGGSVVVRSFFRTHSIDLAVLHGKYEWDKYSMSGKDLFVIQLKTKNLD